MWRDEKAICCDNGTFVLRSDPFRYNDDEPIDKISRALARKAKEDAASAAREAATENLRRASEQVALLHATDDDYCLFDHTAGDLDDDYPYQSHTVEPEAAYPPPDERYTALMREPYAASSARSINSLLAFSVANCARSM